MEIPFWDGDLFLLLTRRTDFGLILCLNMHPWCFESISIRPNPRCGFGLFPSCIKDSNKPEVLAILEALTIYSRSFGDNLIVESDTFNEASSISQKGRAPWKFLYILNEIRALSSSMRVVFKHVFHFANA